MDILCLPENRAQNNLDLRKLCRTGDNAITELDITKRNIEGKSCWLFRSMNKNKLSHTINIMALCRSHFLTQSKISYQNFGRKLIGEPCSNHIPVLHMPVHIYAVFHLSCLNTNNFVKYLQSYQLG